MAWINALIHNVTVIQTFLTLWLWFTNQFIHNNYIIKNDFSLKWLSLIRSVPPASVRMAFVFECYEINPVMMLLASRHSPALGWAKAWSCDFLRNNKTFNLIPNRINFQRYLIETCKNYNPDLLFFGHTKLCYLH